MPRIKAAIVGAGLISRKKHVPAFAKHRNKVDLVALCDVNADAARMLAEEFSIPRTYTDINQMIGRERPDLVDICTPPQTHVTLALEAIQAGCNVLIEKPMALSVSDCDAIVDAAGAAGVKVCVGHSDLFYYPFLEARELVRDGAIGECRGMRIFLSTPTNYMTSQRDHWAHSLPGGVIGENRSARRIHDPGVYQSDQERTRRRVEDPPRLSVVGLR
jgi:predicted dehydrogenase